MQSMPFALPLREQAARWFEEGRPAALVTVSAFKGSVPRETGTRMIVCAEEVQGTIGGGHLEHIAIEQARALLAASDSPMHEKHFPLGPALGQCCGGAVTLRFERLTKQALRDWPQVQPRFHLQLYGAGHVGRAIVRLLEGIACKVEWIDEREEEFPRVPAAAHIQRVCVEPVEAEVREAPPGAFYLVLTHSHDLDMRITEAILKRNDFAYLGLIGSQTKRARFIHRFEARGVNPDAIARMTCPIGVPGIEGKEPEVIAIAVVAQLLQQAGA